MIHVRSGADQVRRLRRSTTAPWPPLFIVLGAACVSVLVEAFVPLAQRWPVAARAEPRRAGGSPLALGLYAGPRARRHTTLAGSLSVDPPSLFLWGTLLALATRQRPDDRRPLGRARRRVRRHPRRRRAAAGWLGCGGDGPRTDPDRSYGVAGPGADDADRGLPVHAVRARRHDRVLRGERPADDVRRARGAQPAAVPDLRARPAPPAALAGGGGQVLPARRVRLGVLPLRRWRCSTATPARCGSPTSRAVGGSRRSDTLLFGGLALLVVGLLFKGVGRPVPHLDPGRLPGRPDPGHRVHGGLHEGRRVRRDPAGAHVAFGATRWEWRGVLWAVAIASMVIGAVLGLTQTDIKRMVAYSSVAHAGFLLIGCHGDHPAGPVRARCSTCWPTASPRSRCSG